MNNGQGQQACSSRGSASLSGRDADMARDEQREGEESSWSGERSIASKRWSRIAARVSELQRMFAAMTPGEDAKGVEDGDGAELPNVVGR